MTLNFVVWLDVIKILCCKWAFALHTSQCELVSRFRGGALQGPSGFYLKGLTCAFQVRVTVADDMMEASPDFGRKLVVE